MLLAGTAYSYRMRLKNVLGQTFFQYTWRPWQTTAADTNYLCSQAFKRALKKAATCCKHNFDVRQPLPVWMGMTWIRVPTASIVSFVSRVEITAGIMNTNKRSRKRYLEPAARSDPLPRPTLHEIRKRQLASSAEPDPNVNSDTPTTSAGRPESPANHCGSAPAEDCSDDSYSSFVEDESTASDCEFSCAESCSSLPPNTSASSSSYRQWKQSVCWGRSCACY